MQRVGTCPVLARSPVLKRLSLSSASTFLSLDLYTALAPVGLASSFRNLSSCLPHSPKHSSRSGAMVSLCLHPPLKAPTLYLTQRRHTRNVCCTGVDLTMQVF